MAKCWLHLVLLALAQVAVVVAAVNGNESICMPADARVDPPNPYVVVLERRAGFRLDGQPYATQAHICQHYIHRLYLQCNCHIHVYNNSCSNCIHLNTVVRHEILVTTELFTEMRAITFRSSR